MIQDQLKKNIIKAVLQLEKENVNNGYPKTKEQMVSEVEKIIISEVTNYENKEN